MNTEDEERLRSELTRISRIIDAPGSHPAQQMRAKRENQSEPWDEAADARRFKAGLPNFMARFKEAARMLAQGSRDGR